MLDDYREKLMQGSIQGTSPERMHARAELRRLMESAIAALPETFRLVFVLREIEEQSVEEVAAMLDLNPATVKTRHLRRSEEHTSELQSLMRISYAVFCL